MTKLTESWEQLKCRICKCLLEIVFFCEKDIDDQELWANDSVCKEKLSN